MLVYMLVYNAGSSETQAYLFPWQYDMTKFIWENICE